MSSTIERIQPSDPFWRGKRSGFIGATLMSFVLLQLLFLGNLSYITGSVYHSEYKVHNLNILTVDYDGGIVGQSLKGAINDLSSPSFLSFDLSTPVHYPTTSDLYHEVFKGHFWGAIYTHQGASDRLAAALQGGAAATSYNASNAITYIYNQARYPTLADGDIAGNLETVIAAARIAYNSINGTHAAQALPLNDPAAIQILLNPITSSNINIKPMTQGARVFYNTVGFVTSAVMQFFFLMAVNGVAARFQLYSRLPIKHNILIRICLSIAYTLCGSLIWTAWFWAFKEDLSVTAGQFFLGWMIVWLNMHINFLVFDIATTFIPQSFTAFFIFTWIIMNITSTIYPFELSPGFYRWAYALPAHEAWQMLIQIWSGGANITINEALPILFAWEVLAIPVAILAVHKRCRSAAQAESREQEKMSAMISKPAAPAAPIGTTLSLASDEEKESPSQGRAQQSDEESVEEREDEAVATHQYYPSARIPFEKTLSRMLSG